MVYISFIIFYTFIVIYVLFFIFHESCYLSFCYIFAQRIIFFKIFVSFNLVAIRAISLRSFHISLKHN